MKPTDFERIIVVDIETSGLKVKTNGILSIGATPLVGDAELYLEAQLNVGQEFHPRALEVNGFTPEECFDPSKLTQKQVVNELYKWVEQFRRDWDERPCAIIGGHNVRFDVNHLQEVKSSWPFQYRLVDTHSLGLGVLGQSLNSSKLCDALNVAQEPKIHNALEGAKMAKRCLTKLFELTSSLRSDKV